MYKALYRDFRPDTFDELIGQDHIVRILKSQLATGAVSHAYLFCGTRGTGKTTTARILAKALNCEDPDTRPCCRCDACRAIREGSYIDVVEIDAASNNGVDNIRDLRDSINYPPVAGRYKIFIIDEVHMLSTGAFNALLKTLEEPPSYVVFILATTEPQKIPATILSRCVRLDFRRVSEQKLMENMKAICRARGVEAEDAALALIAVNADGSVRDSLSILEQCMFPGEVLRRDDVAQILGTAGEEAMIALTESVRVGDAAETLLQLDRMIASGIDVRLLMKQWLEHFRNLLLVKYVKDPGRMLSMSMENVTRVGRQAQDVSTAFLDRAIRELTETISGTRWSSRPRVMLEMSAVKLCASQETEEAFAFRYDGAVPGRSVRTVPEIASIASERAPGFVPEELSKPAMPNVPEGTELKVTESSSEPEEPAPYPGKPDATDDLWEARDIYEDTVPPDDWIPWEDGPAVPAQTPEAEEAETEVTPEEDVHTVPVAETSAERAPEPSAKSGEGPDDRMWQELMDAAASRRGIFTRFIGRSHLTGSDGDTIYISCEDREMEDFLRNRGRETVEQLLKERMGHSLNLSFDTKRRTPEKEKKEKDASGKKEELEAFFGMPVEMK